jgi:flagellar L-ring protein FlgH
LLCGVTLDSIIIHHDEGIERERTTMFETPNTGIRLADWVMAVLRTPNGWLVLTVVALALVLWWQPVPAARAESLFRASAAYTADHPVAPRSLFVIPKPQYVGDSVTIVIDDFAQQNFQMDYKTDKNTTVTQNGSAILNGVTRAIIDKLPIAAGLKNTASSVLSVPSIDGLNNTNAQNTKANVSRQTRLRDTITCQVMQVLPNGDLVVQGRKVNLMTKERTDLFVSGIVNPFYLDVNNQIPSNRVANLQFLQGGNGAISRQQNDGILTKLYQWIQ